MSHADKILAALRTGPKTAASLYSLGCIAHSRIAELRSRGYVIICQRIPGEGASAYVYTLLAEPLEAAPVPGAGVASSGPEPLAIPGQLDLYDVLAGVA